MAREDEMRLAPEGRRSVDEVGMVHVAYHGDMELGILNVEPPKPTPRWLLRLRALMRRRENSRARPQ